MAERLVEDIFTALDEQTVVVPGTGTLDVIVPSLAKSLAAVHEQRRALEVRRGPGVPSKGTVKRSVRCNSRSWKMRR